MLRSQHRSPLPEQAAEVGASVLPTRHVSPSPPSERHSDEYLLNEFRNVPLSEHGRDCLDELFCRYHSRVARWCYRFMNERQAAADLAQEVFLRAYQYLDRFTGRSMFSTWLYAIARNACLDAVQKGRKAQSAEVDALPELPDLSLLNPLEAMEKESLQSQARELLQASLTPTERTVFELHFGQDFPLDVITRLLGLENASGAKGYVVSAKRKLARSIQRLDCRGRSVARACHS